MNSRFSQHNYRSYIWDKVFKSGPSKIRGRQPSKNLKGYGLKQTISLQIFSRLSFTIFSWYTHEYFVPYRIECIVKAVFEFMLSQMTKSISNSCNIFD